MSISFFLGLYLIAWVPIGGPIDLLVLRPVAVAVLIVAYLWLVARASLIVGEHGVRQAWPSRFTVDLLGVSVIGAKLVGTR